MGLVRHLENIGNMRTNAGYLEQKMEEKCLIFKYIEDNWKAKGYHLFCMLAVNRMRIMDFKWNNADLVQAVTKEV